LDNQDFRNSLTYLADGFKAAGTSGDYADVCTAYVVGCAAYGALQVPMTIYYASQLVIDATAIAEGAAKMNPIEIALGITELVIDTLSVAACITSVKECIQQSYKAEDFVKGVNEMMK
jgi:hypothetical protein